MTSSGFKSKRITKTSIIKLDAPMKKVFPLFGPVEEMKRAEGWNPHILYSTGDHVAEHMVFKTKTHAQGETDYTWIVSKYSPEKSLIEYTVFTTERLWHIAIECRQNAADQTTAADITYTYTGLTEKGNHRNEKALQAMYAKDLKEWEEAINYYLKTGKELEHH